MWSFGPDARGQLTERSGARGVVVTAQARVAEKNQWHPGFVVDAAKLVQVPRVQVLRFVHQQDLDQIVLDRIAYSLVQSEVAPGRRTPRRDGIADQGQHTCHRVAHRVHGAVAGPKVACLVDLRRCRLANAGLADHAADASQLYGEIDQSPDVGRNLRIADARAFVLRKQLQDFRHAAVADDRQWVVGIIR